MRIRINVKKAAASAVATLAGALVASTMAAAPALATDNGGFTFTVTGSSHGAATASTTLSNTQDALVNGATQMLWEDQNFNGHLTSKNVKQAFKKRLKVIATGANSSQVIYTRSHHRKEVVVLPGSKLRNTGMHNHIRNGFVWTTGLAVLKYDTASHQYRHAANLLTNAGLQQVRKQNPHKRFKVVGRVKLGHTVYNIVVWCGNYIGGNVVMVPHYVQVASSEDLVQESDAASVAKTLVTVNFNVQCPNNGASFGATGYAYAYASASSHIRYTQHTKLSAVGALELKAKQQISINQTVTADAQASITVSGNCGSGGTSTPPPTATEIDTINDVLINNTRTVTVSGSIASGHTGKLTCHANTGGGSITAGKSQDLGSGSFTKYATYTAGSEVGSDSVTCNVLQDDGQSASVTSNTFQIKQPIADPA